MAELIGLVASVAQLAVSADYIRRLLHDFKKGAEERRRLLAGITSMQMTLDELKNTYYTRQQNDMGEEWLDLVKPLKTRGVFQRIEDLFAEILLKLEPKHTFNKLVARFSWPFVKEDIDRNVRQMHDLWREVSIVLQHVALKLTIITHDRVKKIDLRESRKEQQAILNWFSTMKFVEQQEIESRRAVSGTCDWFLSLQQYRTWKCQQTRILYCKAIAGAGKTVLASKVYDDLQFHTAGQKFGVFIVYLKYDQPDTHVPLKIIGALLRQSIQLQDGRMNEKLERFLDNHYYRESAKPDINAYLTQLRASLENFSSVFFVVDGLDEIKSDTSRIDMINTIEGIRSDASIIFTSRPVLVIDNVFRAVSVLSTTPSSSNVTLVTKILCSECDKVLETRHQNCNNCGLLLCKQCVDTNSSGVLDRVCHELTDSLFATVLDVSARSSAIRTFVRARVEQSLHLGKWIERRPELSKQIEEKVVDMAQKMFLLAQLHMDAIADPDLLKESDFDRALENLPKKLDDSYHQAMERVDSYGRSLIKIVNYANRLLSAAEIEHALGLDIHNGTLRDGDIIPVTSLISRCAGLVTFDAKGYVTFSHYTVADYISNTASTWFPNGHVDLFRRCSSYLHLPAFTKGAELSREEGRAYSRRLSQFPFLDYASVYWATHLQWTDDHDLFQQGLDLVTNSSIFSLIVQALWYSKDLAAVSWRKRTDASPLEFAIFSKFHWLFDQLLTSGIPIMGSNDLQMTPLMLTARVGDLELTKRVLDIGCDVNAVNAENESALHLAIVNGNDDVATLLIDHHGTDVNLITGTSPRLRTPLTLAILQARVKVYMKLLSCPDIDPNVTIRGAATALHIAIDEGDEEALRALISRGGLELHNFPGCSLVTLHIAAECGYVGIVRLLLDTGIDVNIRDTDRNATALMQAADWGYVDVIEELLKHNADWRATDCFGRHALHIAAIKNQSACADYLLTHTEIDVNHRDVYGNTPLHDATVCKDSEIVEILLKHNARTDLVNAKGYTPLDIARYVQAGTETIAILTSNTGGSHNYHALNSVLDASQFGDAEDIRRTIGQLTGVKRPYLEEQDLWTGRTPLHHVTQRGLVDMIPVLHEAGSNLNAKDRYGRTALHTAAIMGSTQAAQYLLENQVDTNTEDIWGVTPLREAYIMSNSAIAILLVEYGIPLKGDVDTQWMLSQATRQGNLKAVKRLIEVGARVDYKLDDGMTLYEYAKDQGHIELAEYLDGISFDHAVSPVKPVVKAGVPHYYKDQMPEIEVSKREAIDRLKRAGTDKVEMRERDNAIDQSVKKRRKSLITRLSTPNVVGLAILTVIQLSFFAVLVRWWYDKSGSMGVRSNAYSKILI